jgi:exodeoxyribonuclease V
VDLRAVFAQTVNKSQGSTYDKVFFDLDDLKKCHNGNTLARLLYVGTSRARHQCFFVGDFG